MMEAAVVVATDGSVLHWHNPHGRTMGSLPDSRDLWDVLWENRAILAGVAHTHPGGGWPSPSWEDVTTFDACESGLGRRLSWWIATANRIRRYRWGGPSKFDYVGWFPVGPTPWLAELRLNSGFNTPIQDESTRRIS